VHNFEDIDPRCSDDLDRRSFLRATGIIAASTIAGGLSLPAIAQQAGPASADRVPTHGARLPAGVLALSGVEARAKAEMTGR